MNFNSVPPDALSGDQPAPHTPLLDSCSRQMPLQVPEGYFDELMLPLRLPAGMPHELSSNYFDILPGQLTEKMTAVPSMKVVKPARTYTAWLAAAAATLVMGLGVQQWASFRQQDTVVPQGKTATTPSAAIPEHYTSESEIRDFLKEEEKLNGTEQPKSVQKEITELTDEDLKGYLRASDFPEKNINGI